MGRFRKALTSRTVSSSSRAKLFAPSSRDSNFRRLDNSFPLNDVESNVTSACVVAPGTGSGALDEEYYDHDNKRMKALSSINIQRDWEVRSHFA